MAITNVTEILSMLSQAQPCSRAQSSASRSNVVRRSNPAKELDCEAVFVNQRAPGSQTIRYSRPKRQPLVTLDDRLQRVLVTKREDDRFTFDGHTYDYIEWTCQSPYDPDKTSIFTSLKLISPPRQTNRLIETPAGRCCPKCKTNEFIRSELKNTPLTYQDKHWRDKESFGEFCENCTTISGSEYAKPL